jgi:cation transport protein ChaC
MFPFANLIRTPRYRGRFGASPIHTHSGRPITSIGVQPTSFLPYPACVEKKRYGAQKKHHREGRSGVPQHNNSNGAHVLTKQLIKSGQYLTSFDEILGNLRWSEEKILASLTETLKKRPRSGETWLFAYGSLIWNPQISFVERRIAVLDGWRRSFSLRIIAGRATPDAPGRMLQLREGSSTEGVALRLPESQLMEELRTVWIREMVVGSYLPIWEDIEFLDGTQASALVFVANTGHALYEPNDEVGRVAPLVASAAGHLGTNREYVERLNEALASEGLFDRYVAELHTAIQKIKDSKSG